MWKWIKTMSDFFSLPLKKKTKILAFSGSLRESSNNKKLLLEAASIVRELGADVNVINLKDLPIPFYDGDIGSKEGIPENVRNLRRLMIQSQVIFIATPEYNGSIPAVLKNILDWTSLDDEGNFSRKAYEGKKFFIMCASSGPRGGSWGLDHLRLIIEIISGTAHIQQFVLQEAHTAFDEQGNFKEPNKKTELQKVIQNVLLYTS